MRIKVHGAESMGVTCDSTYHCESLECLCTAIIPVQEGTGVGGRVNSWDLRGQPIMVSSELCVSKKSYLKNN